MVHNGMVEVSPWSERLVLGGLFRALAKNLDINPPIPKPPQTRLNPSQWPSEYVRALLIPPPKRWKAQLPRWPQSPTRNGTPELKVLKTNMSPLTAQRCPQARLD